MLDKREGEEDHELRDVLLVEDSLIDAQLIRRLLRRVSAAYYRITHVRTLNDAVLSAEELMPDVILADLAACSSAGARFLQIQPCFDMAVLRDFMQGLVEAQLTWNYAVMLSLAPLTSVEAVQRLREQQFGSIIPVSVSERLQSARKPRKEGIAICSELIREARNIPGVAGINLITMDNPQDVVESIRQSFD